MPDPGGFRLFAYGTLQVPAVLQAVIGGQRHGSPALLPGFRRFRVPGKPYPAIVANAGGSVTGLLYEAVSAAELALLDYYEGELYERRELLVELQQAGADPASAAVLAQSYVLGGGHGALITDEPWDLQRFEREHLASYLERLGPTPRAP